MRAKEKKEINILIGENIRFYREQAGYSREQLSEFIEITPRFLADAELGFVGISITNLKKICELLGISSDRLLWDNKTKEITLSERVSHIDKKYFGPMEKLIKNQLEIISLAEKINLSKTKTVGLCPTPQGLNS